MKNKYLILIAVGIVVILGALYLVNNNNDIVNLVNVDEFENLIGNEEVFVINAHIPYAGEIQGTDLIAEDWENMASYSDKLPQDKNAPIAVYCRSGRMSAISSQQLVELGYKNVYDLDGGMKAWESSGRELLFKE